MAPNGKTPPFSLITKNTVLIKPSEPTPSEPLSLSTIDNGPNLEIICQTIYVYRPKPPLSHQPASLSHPSDPAATLKKGLARALVHYYPLAGKIKRGADGDCALRVTCNADGVPFAEAAADCRLDSVNYFDKIDVETAQKLVLDYPSESVHGYYPLLLQITKFGCGGFTIGMGLSHSICDGLGAARLFQAIVELASGRNEPVIKPVWERERLLGNPNNYQEENFKLFDSLSLTKSPYLPAKKLSHECFHIDTDSIKRLKSYWTKQSNNSGLAGTDGFKKGPFTTIEILGAYVWRARLRALNQARDKKTVFHLAVGIRHRVDPPLPEGYYGNAFVSANVALTGQELDEKPLSEVAGLIKKNKKRAAEAAYIKEWLNFSEAFRRRKAAVDAGGAAMVLTDWRQLKLMEEVDFGPAELVNMTPVPSEMVGFVSLCVFLPANRINPAMEGGVRVMVYLPEEAMNVFKQEMNDLKVGPGNGADNSSDPIDYLLGKKLCNDLNLQKFI